MGGGGEMGKCGRMSEVEEKEVGKMSERETEREKACVIILWEQESFLL